MEVSAHQVDATPRVTLLLVNWNGLHHLQEYLPSVLATTYSDFEILVWDNASEDGSVAWLRTQHPKIRVVDADANYGFAGGNNRALAHVRTPYVCLLNTDVRVSPDWLGPLVAALDAEPRRAAVQPKVRADRMPTHFEHAGAAGGWIDTLGYPFCRGRVLEQAEADHNQYDTPSPVFWTTGACMLARMETIHQIGLFDEAFFAHMEEIDFCWRAQRAGWQLWAEPRSVVYHLGGGTLAYNSPRKAFLNFRNSLLMLTKNLPARQVIPLVVLRLILDGLAGLMFLARGQWRQTLAIMRSHLSYYGLARDAWRKRGPWPTPSLSKLAGVYSGSMIWAAYGRGRRTFDAILGRR